MGVKKVARVWDFETEDFIRCHTHVYINILRAFHHIPSQPLNMHTWIFCVFGLVDVDVKNGANLLDRLIKDIVTESEMFDVEKFIPLLQKYIERTNPYIRQVCYRSDY